MESYLADLFAGDRDAIIMTAAAYFAICGVFATVNNFRLSRWPVVVGRMIEEGVAPTGGRPFSQDEQEYVGQVRYAYEVEGKAYQGELLSPLYLMASHNLRFVIEWQMRWIERVGESGVHVRHHPKKPQKSHLIGVGPRTIAMTASLCFGAALLLMLATG